MRTLFFASFATLAISLPAAAQSDVYPTDPRCPPGYHIETKIGGTVGVKYGVNWKSPFGATGPEVTTGIEVSKPGNRTAVCVPNDPTPRPRSYGPDISGMSDTELDNRIRQAENAVADLLARMEELARRLAECLAEQADGHPRGEHGEPDPEEAYTPAGMCRDCVSCEEIQAEFDKAYDEWLRAVEQLDYLKSVRDSRRRP